MTATNRATAGAHGEGRGNGRAMAAPPRPHGRGLDLVPRRTVLGDSAEIGFRLAPGDHALVSAGDAIVAGTTIAQRLRDPRLVELSGTATDEGARPGDRWSSAGRPPA